MAQRISTHGPRPNHGLVAKATTTNGLVAKASTTNGLVPESGNTFGSFGFQLCQITTYFLWLRAEQLLRAMLSFE